MGTLRRGIRAGLAPLTHSNPAVKRWLMTQRHRLGAMHHALARVVPAVLPTSPRNLTIAITARCNLRCAGCRYERDFMLGEQLSLAHMRTLLDDAKAAGFESVRLYGGEPLLHPDLPAIVAHAAELRLPTFITTNGVALGAKIDELVDAGCRYYTLGFYGTGDFHARYTERPGAFERIVRSIETVRERYGASVHLRVNWLLMRPSCNRASWQAVWDFAKRFDTPIQVDLVHYSLPYFTEGPERELQFRPEDEAALRDVTQAMLESKAERPDLMDGSVIGLRSIPDWLLKGPAMQVPCDRYKMIWVGADGSVQLCYVTFPLGNLHEHRLRDLLGTAQHRDAVRGAFRLDCPNCHCGYDHRVQRDLASRWRYRS